jgi:hypothetical protein
MRVHQQPGGIRRRTLVAAGVLAIATTIAVAPPASAEGVPGLESRYTSVSTPSVGPDFIFSRGFNGTVVYASAGNGITPAFQGLDFISLGGAIVGDPRGVKTLDGPRVFVRDTNNQVFTALIRNYSIPFGFTGFVAIPGVTATSEIAPVALPNGDVRIFVRDINGILTTNLLVHSTQTWTGWRGIRGFVTSEITATLGFFPNTLGQPGMPGQSIRIIFGDIQRQVITFLVGLDGSVGPATTLSSTDSNISHVASTDEVAYQFQGNVAIRSLRTGAAQGVPGAARADPALNQLADGSTALIVRGTKNALFVNRRPAGGRFGSYVGLGGVAVSNAVINPNSLNLQDIFLVGERGVPFLNTQFANGNWTGYYAPYRGVALG